MSATYKIALNGLRFFAEHGMYPEEKKVGNEFEVNVFLYFPAPQEKLFRLDQTIDYAEVYTIVKTIFSERKALLETLAEEIAATIHSRFPVLLELQINITKLSPPILNFTGSVTVEYHKKFN